MFIVLAISGKHDSVDRAQVRLFEEKFDADWFCQSINTGARKYWTKAEVVDDAEVVELSKPEEN